MTDSRLLLAALALGALSLPVTAQQPGATGAALAWVGCWEPMDAMPGSGVTCVLPSGGDLNTLRVLEVEGNKATQVSVIALDGAQHPVTAEGCSGWERARLSADGGRILLDAEVSCAGLPMQKRSGAYVITPRGEWLHVQGSSFGAPSGARVRLFREYTYFADLPADVIREVSVVLGIAEATRADVAGRTLSAADVRELAALDVAEPVVDVIVAAGFPKAFVLDPSGGANITSAPREPSTGTDSRVRFYPSTYGFGYPVMSLGLYDQYMRECMLNMWGMFDYQYCARTSQFARYGYRGNFYGYGYGFGSGWLPGYGYGGGVVVIPRPVDVGPRESGGRVVKGQGYSSGSGGTSTGGTAQPRTRATPANAGSAGASTGGSTGSSAGSASSGGSNAGSSSRTAKPRSP